MGNVRVGTVVTDANRRFVGQREKRSVLRKAVRHWKRIDELVIAPDVLAVGSLACDGRLDARFGHVITNAKLLPLRIAWAALSLSENGLLLSTHFVVCHKD